MAVFRVEKTKDFTIMSNHHLRNTELSLKAKGLLSLMLSLPEDWDYTTKGLAHFCKDGVDSITTALKELERHGYLTRQRLRYDNGQLGDIEYTIHEQPVSTENTGFSPKRENPRQVKPEQAKPKQAEPEQENPAQLNTNPLKTKKSKKDKSITYPSIYPAEPEAANRTDGMDRIELIEAYREIIKENIEYAGCNKPMERLWISSMEDAAIREGFDHLRPGSDYDKLYDAAVCRAGADWLIGINATRLFSVLYHIQPFQQKIRKQNRGFIRAGIDLRHDVFFDPFQIDRILKSRNDDLMVHQQLIGRRFVLLTLMAVETLQVSGRHL